MILEAAPTAHTTQAHFVSGWRSFPSLNVWVSSPFSIDWDTALFSIVISTEIIDIKQASSKVTGLTEKSTEKFSKNWEIFSLCSHAKN